MELLLPYLPLYLVIIFLAGFLLRRKIFRDTKQLPPGKTGWVVSVKETWEFYQRSKYGFPEKFVTDRMSKYSRDVFATSLLGTNIAVLCGASGNKFLYSNDNKLFDMWWPSSMLQLVPEVLKTSLRSDPTSMRSLVFDFVKPESLAECVPIIDSMTREHLGSHWLPHKTVKVVPLVKKFTFSVACRIFFSIKDLQVVTRLEHPLHLLLVGLLSLPINLPCTALNRAVKGVKIIRKEIISRLRQRKEENTACMDVLDLMLVAKDKKGRIMSEKESAEKAIGFILGSHDSVNTTIAFVVKHLAENPHIYEKVFEEQMEIANSKSAGELLSWNDVKRMKYSWCVACESLRMTPMGITIIRQAKTDIAYAGFIIPKGWKTVYAPCSTHMNPEYFPDPEKFDPSRFEGNGPAPFTFTPFGGGPRMCPGRDLARVEILIFMYNLVMKFKLEKLNLSEKTEYDIFPFPMPKDDLPICLYPVKAEV